MNIAFCIDDSFAAPLAATVHSLLSGLSDQTVPDLYIIGDVSPQKRRRLLRVIDDRANAHWLHPATFPISTDLLKTTDNISISTYYRVLLPRILPDDCEKVLYLDADVIIRGDVRPIWNIDFGDNIVMAVRDAEVYEVSSPQGLRAYEELGIPEDSPYFNAGVLYIDLDAWKRANVTDRFFTYLKEYQDYVIHADQDGLNAVLSDRWGCLSERWNLQTASLENKKCSSYPERDAYVRFIRKRLPVLKEGPHIMHYTRGRKPWHPHCPHPYKHLFHAYFQDSGYYANRAVYPYWYGKTLFSWLGHKLYQKGRRFFN